MTHRSSICAIALVTALLEMPCAAQVVDFGKYPDLRGQWVRPPGSPNNWIRLAGPPPLTPEYQKIWEDIQADLKAGGPGNWPSTFCIPAGMPAMMSFYDPAEIIVTPGTTYILISHNDDSYRRIYTDGRDWPSEIALTFAGYSIGKWIDEDGDGKYDVLEAVPSSIRSVFAYRALRKIWLGRADHSALMLRARMTLPHFSVSSTMSLPKAAGEPGRTVPPRSASRDFILGSARPALISLFSLSTISAGVSLGAPMPCSALAS
jgi:hypothetical protein